MKPPFASSPPPAISRAMSDDPFSDPNPSINETDRKKRLTFRAWRRGFKEADLIMGRFAEARLEGLNPAELDEFERLLDAPDTEVYAWITGRAETPSNYDGPVLDALKGFRHEAIVSDGPGGN
jgi:antitoxin CptB